MQYDVLLQRLYAIKRFYILYTFCNKRNTLINLVLYKLYNIFFLIYNKLIVNTRKFNLKDLHFETSYITNIKMTHTNTNLEFYKE